MKKNFAVKYRWLTCLLLLVFVVGLISGTIAFGQGSDVYNNNIVDVGENIVLNYVFEPPVMQESSLPGYYIFEIPELGTQAITGEPLVPYKQVALVVPDKMTFADISVKPGRKISLGEYLIKPASKPIPINARSYFEDTTALPNEVIYSSSEPYPVEIFSSPQTHTKSGVSILLFNLYPLNYIPATGEVSYYDSFKVTITLDSTVSIQEHDKHISPTARDMEDISRMVENPLALDSYRETSTGRIAGMNSKLLSGHYDHVIITRSSLKAAFMPLAQWRLQNGLRSKVVTVEAILEAYSGVDEPEQIRNFIRDAKINNKLDYVLLGGDADGPDPSTHIVPARSLWGVRETDPPGVLSDLYYACLDGDFDGNNSGIYGEIHDSDVDLFADVRVGRAPVETVNEVNNFVNKLIAYESSSPDDPYLREAWMVGELLAEDTSCAAGTIVHSQQEVEPSGYLENIRWFRDHVLKKEYVELYYRHDDVMRAVLLHNPVLLLEAGLFMARFGSEFADFSAGRDSDLIIDQKIVGKMYELIETFLGSVKKLEDEIGSDKVKELEGVANDLVDYLKRVEGKNFTAAIMDSPYVQSEINPGEPGEYDTLQSRTWGGCYKDEVKDGSSRHGYKTAGFSPAFMVGTLYDRDLDNEWTTESMIEILDGGPHLINHLGHSNNFVVMRLNMDVEGSSDYNEDHLNSINNHDYFFIYSQGCYAASFDNRSAPVGDMATYYEEDSIAEEFVTRDNGAFAFIGNSRFGFYRRNSTDGPSQRYDRQFWHAVMLENIHELGRANEYSKEVNINQALSCGYMRTIYYGLNLLGDPATRLHMPPIDYDLGIPILELADTALVDEEVEISALIHNYGKEVQSVVPVEFYIDGNLYRQTQINDLAPGAGKNAIITWYPPESGEYEVSVKLPVIDDYPDNNTRKAQIRITETLTVAADEEFYPGTAFRQISDAIAASSPGDTIEVYPGNYEPFKVNKSINLVGFGAPVIEGQAGENGVVEIETIETELTGFAVIKSGKEKAGIYVSGSNNTIARNRIVENDGGLVLDAASNNVVRLNFIESNNDCGLGLQQDSQGNTIKENLFFDNEAGMKIHDNEDTQDEVVISNVVSDNTFEGNKNDVLDDDIAELMMWYDPVRQRGNYWADQIYGADRYPLDNPFELGNITGTILFSDRESHEGIRVSLQSAGFYTKTYADGAFEFFNLPTGKGKTLLISYPGYGSVTVPIDIMPGDNELATVILTDECIVNVISDPARGGSVTITGEGIYQIGEEVTVTAIANTADGFEFGYWTEDGKVVHDEAEYTFIATSDRNLFANFYTHRVAYIPVYNIAGPQPKLDIKDLEVRAKLVRDYFHQQSSEKVSILSDFKFENWQVLTISAPTKEDLMDAAIELADIKSANYDAVVIINSDEGNRAFARAIGERDEGLTELSIGNQVYTSDRHSMAVWAHELGHAIFKWYDYYETDTMIGDFINVELDMDTWGWLSSYFWSRGQVGYWGLMGRGCLMNPPAPVMSYNRHLAGWLDYTKIEKGDTKHIPYLMKMESDIDHIYRFDTGIKQIPYYIFEARDPYNEVSILDQFFEHSNYLKDAYGIVIYQVENKTRMIRDPEKEGIPWFSITAPHVYNIASVDRLMTYPSRRVTLVPGDTYRCDLTRAKFTAHEFNSRLRLEVAEQSLLEYGARRIVRLSNNIIVFHISPLKAPIFSPSETTNGLSFDIDLHLTTQDGLTVGMDYETGQYVVEIPGARTSGNIDGGGAEWISIPVDTEASYRIDTTPAIEWLEEAGLAEVSIETSVETIEIDDQGKRTITDEETIKVELANIILTANPAGGGVVSGGGVFEPGAEVTVSAMANEGYEFLNWTEDGEKISDSKTFSFTVTKGRNLVANFESLYDPVPDGLTTLYAQNQVTGQIKAIIVDEVAENGLGVEYDLPAPLNANWFVRAVGDVNGDGYADLVLQNAFGRMVVWYMENETKIGREALDPEFTNERIQLVDIYNGDLFFQNVVFGGRFVWKMDGVSRDNGYPLDHVNVRWSLAAVADMGKDGSANFIFEKVTGERNYWVLDEDYFRVRGDNFERTGPAWSIKAVHDMNYSGQPDLVLQHTDGRISVWIMEGMVRDEDASAVIGTLEGWNIVGAVNAGTFIED